MIEKSREINLSLKITFSFDDIFGTKYIPLEVKGAKPGMKKCNLGKGTMLTANFLKSAFN